ncbi:MAG: single-stranded DNA-binding protein [Acidobacteriota bacterium]|nr:single-stranded DNA-binding protein [Acidobacteriota bacterium]
MGELKLVRINRVQLSGRVTKDLTVRYAPGGTPVVTFTLAFNRWIKDESDNWKEIPGFIGVLASGRLAERCGEHLRKGSPLYVEGRLQSRRWEDRDGRNRNVIEIRADQVQFLERESHPSEEEAGFEPPDAKRSKSTAVEEGELFSPDEIEEQEA